MNHQPHSAAEAANLITDWLTDDDLSDEEEDQQEDENLSSVVDAARQRQDRRLLSSSSDSYESSESSNSDSDISNSSFGSNANGASTHLRRTRRYGKIVQLRSLEELLPTMYIQVRVMSLDKFRSLFPHHMMHGSTSFLKLFFALL